MNLSEFLILLFTLKVGVVNWIALKTMLWEFPGGLVVRTQCFHCWGPGLMVAQSVKNLPAVWEMWVWPLGWEDPLEKEMATHSSVLAWRTPWTEHPGGLKSMGSKSQTRLSDSHFHFSQCLILSVYDCVCVCVLAAQSCPTLCHSLLPAIFPTQELNPHLPHCRQILYHLSHQGSPVYKIGYV